MEDRVLSSLYWMWSSIKMPQMIFLLFQREVLVGPLNVAKIDNILWQVERTVTKVFLPFLNSALITNTVEKSMKSKIRKSIIEIQKMYFKIKTNNAMASF